MATPQNGTALPPNAQRKVVVIGAGMGGLAAALDLAAQGHAVTLLEKADGPGGKVSTVDVAGRAVDCGPTVLTMRWVFDALFNDAGADLGSQVAMTPADIIARHAWNGEGYLDLYTDIDRSAESIAAFSGPDEADRFRRFCDRARSIYATLDASFMQAQRPSFPELLQRLGPGGLWDLQRLNPYTTLWRKLGDFFRDPRLQQLFGRYATYCGGSPFEASPTLILVAHVEQSGVWLVEGGMGRLAQALAGQAAAMGVDIQYGAEVESVGLINGRAGEIRFAGRESIAADAVVVNADSGAVAAGLLGEDIRRAAPTVRERDRSLAAMTWAFVAKTSGFPLVRHSVFFSQDYRAEFDRIFGQAAMPVSPTIYVCAQDRGAGEEDAAPDAPERLFCIMNAPARGDTGSFDPTEIDSCENALIAQLERCGLHLSPVPEGRVVRTPQDFETRFPRTGGAIYGPAPHGWQAAFRRAGARTPVPGLYLAGGSIHPGPGVAMAALSGRLAARAVHTDLRARRPAIRPSTGRSRTMATPGGMSTP